MVNIHSVLRKINGDIVTINGNTFEDCICYDENGYIVSKPTVEDFNSMCDLCDLEECKVNKKASFQSAYDAEVDEGFTYGDSIFDFDDTTLGIIGARLALNEAISSPTTADLTFYDADKVAVVFAGKEEFKAFAIAFIIARNTIDQKRVSLKAQINDCTTVESVQAIKWD